jgi:hypothetical protein
MRRSLKTTFLVAFAVVAFSTTADAQETLIDPKMATVPRFADETANVGIDSVYKGEWQYGLN